MKPYEIVTEKGKPVRNGKYYIVLSMSTGELINVDKNWLLTNIDDILNLTKHRNNSVNVINSKYDRCMKQLVKSIRHDLNTKRGLRLDLKELKILKFRKFSSIDTIKKSGTMSDTEAWQYIMYHDMNPCESYYKVMQQVLGEEVYQVMYPIDHGYLMIYPQEPWDVDIRNFPDTKPFQINGNDLVLLLKTIITG